jgi:nucleoside-diphosphate-sugar epimerase
MTERRGLVLVTGANGFIGSHLVEALLDKGYAVRCMVRETSDLTYISDLAVEWAYADLRDEAALHQACHGVDAICHCGSLTRALDEETMMRVNAGGTQALAHVCVHACPGLRRFLFISSQTACGPAQGPADLIDECCHTEPITWYGKSKLAAERTLHDLDSRLPLTILRPAAVFGPRDRDFLIYFELVKRGLNLHIGHDDRWLSLIYVHDLVVLIILALESERAVGEIYFASTTDRTHVELANAIATALDKKPHRISIPEALLTPNSVWTRVLGRLTGSSTLLDNQRVLDLRERFWLCSGEKAKRDLGFTPQHDLETAIQATANWYLDSGWL